MIRHLHHQHGVTRRIEARERGYAVRELIAQNDPRDAHNVSSRGGGMAGAAAPRQRREQYFTFSQSRAHFLRQAKGRPQCAQGLAGSSDFERIFGIALQGHGLAAQALT